MGHYRIARADGQAAALRPWDPSLGVKGLSRIPRGVPRLPPVPQAALDVWSRRGGRLLPLRHGREVARVPQALARGRLMPHGTKKWRCYVGNAPMGGESPRAGEVRRLSSLRKQALLRLLRRI